MNEPLRKGRRKVTVIFLPVEVDGPRLDGSLLVPPILLHLALRGAPPQLHHLGRAGLRRLNLVAVRQPWKSRKDVYDVTREPILPVFLNSLTHNYKVYAFKLSHFMVNITTLMHDNFFSARWNTLCANMPAGLPPVSVEVAVRARTERVNPDPESKVKLSK